MITIGLTGGIGMGKSTTLAIFSSFGIPVWDADAAVHRLYSPGGFAVGPVLERFPSAGGPLGGINRALLAEAVLGKPEEIAALEEIVHPLVSIDQAAFRDAHEKAGTEMVVFDIPLLLEKPSENRPDYIIVCSAPEHIRKARVLKRPDMTEEKYNRIAEIQMPDDQKQRFADYVIQTDEGVDKAREDVKNILADIRAKALDGQGEQPQN